MRVNADTPSLFSAHRLKAILRTNPFTRPFSKAGRGIALAWILTICTLASSHGELCAATKDDNTLTTAREVRALSAEEAAKALPVRLHGIYMGEADPRGIAFVMHDEREGIYVQAPQSLVQSLKQGDLLDIEGITNPGGYAPYVVAERLHVSGRGEVPQPRMATLDELYSGQMDAQWLEIEGVIRSIEPVEASDAAPPPPGTRYAPRPGSEDDTEGPVFKVKLASGNSRVMVEIKSRVDPEEYLDAKVSLRGLCFNLHNRNRQFVKPFVQMPKGTKPTILQAAPQTLFCGEPIPVADLFQFGRNESNPEHRVHIRGVVIHHQPGTCLWLRDGNSCIRVESHQNTNLRPGDMVDVLGYPKPGEYTPILEDARFRKYASGPGPEPTVLTDIPSALHNDANLVQLKARLTEVRQFPESVELTLEWLGTPVRAHIQTAWGRHYPASWQQDSIVQVQGICAVETDEPGPLGGMWVPKSFQLLLRSEKDLTVIQTPPWWNAEHLAWLLASFLLITIALIAAISWQSKQRLKRQILRRAMAEAEFSAILSERNRLAREIHDTLSQSLGAISVQLELARTHANDLSDEIRDNLGTAHKLARAALAEARDSIWNMRSQMLEECDLGEALSRILNDVTDNTKVNAVTTIKGNRRRLSPMVENNLLRIGQEAINNANTHAQATEIMVSVTFEKRRIHLEVKDNGIGFVEKAQPVNHHRRFGLIGIRERVDLLGGTVSIKSIPRHGTHIQVSVPG